MSGDIIDLPVKQEPDEMDKLMSETMMEQFNEVWETVGPKLQELQEQVKEKGAFDEEMKVKMAGVLTYFDVTIAQLMASLIGAVLPSHVTAHAFMVDTEFGTVAVRVATGDEAKRMMKNQRKWTRAYEAMVRSDPTALPANVLVQRMSRIAHSMNEKARKAKEAMRHEC